jgi:DNA end-binding protein Ku
MATAKSAKKDVAAAEAAVATLVAKPTIDLTPSKKTASSATFDGTMTFGVMSFPIKTYKATDADGVEFNTVHKCVVVTKDGDKEVTTDNGYQQLKQGSMYCPCCNKTVENGDKLKGFNLGTEKAPQFIAVTPEDIKAQQPTSDKVMNLVATMKESEIDPIFYESFEFIAAAKGGEAPLSKLVAGLKRNGLVAKGIRVKGGRQQEFVLRPYGDNQASVSYLRSAVEVRNFTKLAVFAPSTDPKVAAMEAKMDKMIDTLLVNYQEEFTPANEDLFLANTRRMLEAKAAGVEVVTPTVAAAPDATVDLMAAMQAMLDAAPKSKKASATK